MNKGIRQVLHPVLIGLIAAVAAEGPHALQVYCPWISRLAAILILEVTILVVILQRFIFDRKPVIRGYCGLSDLFLHIHGSGMSDSPGRWTLRGVISFLLAAVGAPLGAEGAASEFGHAFAIRSRERSSRWFEQRRRTDAGAALAAGISAAFGAPFAGILVPIELGMGGETISSVLSSLSAFVGMRWITRQLALEKFSIGMSLQGFRLTTFHEWICLLIIALLAGVLAAGVIQFNRYGFRSLKDLFQSQIWARTLVGGILLFLLVFLCKQGSLSPRVTLEQVFLARNSLIETLFLFLIQGLGLVLVLAAFGTVGIFWPLFALGGMLGYGVDQLIPCGTLGFSTLAIFTGGASFLAAGVGTPIAGALLAYELTHNLNVLVPCLIAGALAQKIRSVLKTAHWVESDLQLRGVHLVGGRSLSILESIPVREAMVTDFETVGEKEPVSELQSKLIKSRYPFLPVVNPQGRYLGLLTVDMVQESRNLEDPLASHSPLSRLLEAKDLLYRSGFKTPALEIHDKLSATAGVFEEGPCVPVLGEEGRVLGLLFAYNVRFAYEREEARRSLLEVDT